jgi:hypothetical protein
MNSNRFRLPLLLIRYWIFLAILIATMISTSATTVMNAEDSSDLLGSTNSAVRYQVGNPDFEGRTVVVIRGDGTATVEFVRETEKMSFNKPLDPERFEQIRSTLFDPRQLTPSTRNPAPDEAEIQIEITVGDRVWSVTFRDQDRWNQTNLQKDVDLFETVAREVSDGSIQF